MTKPLEAEAESLGSALYALVDRKPHAEDAHRPASFPDEPLRSATTNGMRPDQAAFYIAQLTGELSRIARAAKLDVLAYFLEMARLEASRTARRQRAAGRP